MGFCPFGGHFSHRPPVHLKDPQPLIRSCETKSLRRGRPAGILEGVRRKPTQGGKRNEQVLGGVRRGQGIPLGLRPRRGRRESDSSLGEWMPPRQTSKPPSRRSRSCALPVSVWSGST